MLKKISSEDKHTVQPHEAADFCLLQDLKVLALKHIRETEQSWCILGTVKIKKGSYATSWTNTI